MPAALEQRFDPLIISHTFRRIAFANPCALPRRERRGAAAAVERTCNGQQNADRRDPSGGNPGGRPARQSCRGIRLRKRQPQTASRQYLSSESHARRAVAAGGVRRLRRKPSRLPRLFGNPSGLLPDPGRRPAGADRGRRARAARRRKTTTKTGAADAATGTAIAAHGGPIATSSRATNAMPRESSAREAAEIPAGDAPLDDSARAGRRGRRRCAKSAPLTTSQRATKSVMTSATRRTTTRITTDDDHSHDAPSEDAVAAERDEQRRHSGRRLHRSGRRERRSRRCRRDRRRQ